MAHVIKERFVRRDWERTCHEVDSGKRTWWAIIRRIACRSAALSYEKTCIASSNVYYYIIMYGL